MFHKKLLAFLYCMFHKVHFIFPIPGHETPTTFHNNTEFREFSEINYRTFISLSKIHSRKLFYKLPFKDLKTPKIYTNSKYFRHIINENYHKNFRHIIKPPKLWNSPNHHKNSVETHKILTTINFDKSHRISRFYKDKFWNLHSCKLRNSTNYH